MSAHNCCMDRITGEDGRICYKKVFCPQHISRTDFKNFIYKP